jgi:hypothetical protein
VSGDTDVSDGNPSSDTVSDRSDGSDAQTVNDEAERIEALFGTSNDDMCPVHLRPLVNGRCGLCIAHKHNKQRTAV